MAILATHTGTLWTDADHVARETLFFMIGAVQTRTNLLLAAETTCSTGLPPIPRTAR